jgi:hypothetical protein
MSERNSEFIEPSLAALGTDIAAGEALGPAFTTFGFQGTETEMAAMSTDDGLIFGVDILMAWKDVFDEEFRMTKGFIIHVRHGDFDKTYRLRPMGTSLTQEHLRRLQEEKERAKKSGSAP